MKQGKLVRMRPLSKVRLSGLNTLGQLLDQDRAQGAHAASPLPCTDHLVCSMLKTGFVKTRQNPSRAWPMARSPSAVLQEGRREIP